MTFANSGTAQTMLLDVRDGFDLVITNSPREFIAMPDMRLLYLSANPDPEAILGFARALCLEKPFHPRDLFACVDKLLS